jgi:predicted amidohydrolase YtcJ
VCDSHLHLLEYANFLVKVDCETVTREECLQRVRRQVELTPPGQWVLGHGWNHNRWPEGYGNARLLDEISSSHPIYLTAKSLHAGWTNNAALAAAGIQTDTPDPKGGKILRDESGKPTGILLESAMQLAEKVIPPASHDETKRRLQHAFQQLNRFGITSVHDFDTWDLFPILQEFNRNNALPLRVVKSIPRHCLPQAIESGLRSGQRDGNLQVGWLKLFSDGALGAQSAAMLQPYEGNPANLGMLMMEAEEIIEIGRQAVKNGIELAIHAIGDRANRVVLDAFRSLRKIESRLGLPHRRHRIEHVQLIQPADQVRLSEMDILASMQPIHVLSDQDMADRYWGARCQFAYAWNSLLKHGSTLLFGSDAPVETPNPFIGLAAATSRRRLEMDSSQSGWQPQECLTFQKAFNCFTTAPAFAAGQSEHQGKLAPGYLADLMVLEKNPFTMPADKLAGLLPAKTMLNGEWVWG